jgi:hypothetical protein
MQDLFARSIEDLAELSVRSGTRCRRRTSPRWASWCRRPRRRCCDRELRQEVAEGDRGVPRRALPPLRNAARGGRRRPALLRRGGRVRSSGRVGRRGLNSGGRTDERQARTYNPCGIVRRAVSSPGPPPTGRRRCGTWRPRCSGTADRDDHGQGEGAAAVRRAADHAGEAGRPARPAAGGAAEDRGPRRSREAVRRHRTPV